MAAAIGLNEAIVVQQVHYWLTLSSNERDNRMWVYKTYPEWQTEFPFWSDDTVYRTFKKLEAEGILLSTDEYNQIATDRTKWYSIDYEELDGRGLLSLSPQVAETSTATCGGRAPQSAEVEHRKLRRSRAPQLAEVLPETTQRLLTESKESAGDAGEPPTPPETKSSDLAKHSAIKAFREAAHRYPPKAWYQDIVDAVGDDVEKWKSIVKQWVGNGWNPTNVSGMLDVFHNGWIRNSPGNGNRPSSTPGTIPKGMEKQNRTDIKEIQPDQREAIARAIMASKERERERNQATS